MLKRYGDDYYSKLGVQGGSVCCRKGFAARPDLAREASRKGLEARRRNRVRTNEAKVERDD